MLPPALLDLQMLTQRSWRGLTSALAQTFAEAATVCLHHHRPTEEVVELVVQRSPSTSRLRLRRLPMTEQMLAAHDDLREATERGATGLAVLLAFRELGYEIVRRARTRTGVDYWLSKPGEQFFSARLEVSGILANPQKVMPRRAGKQKQSTRSDESGVPAVVVVVEFGTPVAVMEVRP